MRITATLSGKALKSNWRTLLSASPGSALLPMVKAEAYGHGALWVAQNLLSLPRLSGFGVATLDEGSALREGLGSAGCSIVVFSGTLPWSDGCGDQCLRFGLTPVVSTVEDWRRFSRSSWARRIPFELKLNSGMNRLGIPLPLLGSVAADLRRLARTGVFPRAIHSHLAMGEAPSAAISRLQKAAFEQIVGCLAPILPDGVEFSLANSAAILNEKKWRLPGTPRTRVRPGLALYGIPPEEASAAVASRLRPVLELHAPVVALQSLRPGDAVGYGASYKARRPGTIAILGAGYGDGLHRALGGDGRVILRGRSVRFAGRISMDLCAVEAPPGTRVGDRALLFGKGIDPWEQARAAGTIPYEFLTSLGARVQRIHE